MNNINFHGDDVTPSTPDKALFHIIPVPFEQSVSYGTGTANGPKAILDASCQLELFDGESIPAEHGLCTSPFVDCKGDVLNILQNITTSVSHCLDANKIPVVLGGEHTVTLGVINALLGKYDDFGVIQFDAHADLRDTYEGSKYSHACVMKRIYDKNIPIFQLGTRSYSLEEHKFRKENNILFVDSKTFFINGMNEFKLPDNFPDKVFITFDIDGLDSSIIPATGTPVPGGLYWYQTMQIIEKIMNEKICIGFDLVELAPIPQLPSCDYTAAQLIYNMMGFLTRSKVNQTHWNL